MCEKVDVRNLIAIRTQLANFSLRASKRYTTRICHLAGPELSLLYNILLLFKHCLVKYIVSIKVLASSVIKTKQIKPTTLKVLL